MIRDQGIKGSRGTASLADATPLFNDGLPFPVFPCFLDAGRLHAKSMSDTDLESVRNEEWFKEIRWSDEPK